METIKLYDRDAYETAFDAKVISCVEEDGRYEVVLEKTLFFPEEGGQTPDKGMLGGADVLDVQIKGDVIIHTVSNPLIVGENVAGEIDWKHRFFNMQQHSAEHIFSGLANKKYGYQNVGFHLSNQIVTMDFDGVFTESQLEEMEWEVNQAIVKNVEIKTGYPSKEELVKLKYRSKIEIEKDVRIVEIVGYDMCACCAPHVRRTGEIGIFKIQSAQNYKGGMRISFLCGFRALEECRKKSKLITELTGILTTNQENLPEHVTKLKTQIQSLKTQLNNANQELMERKISEIPNEQKNVILFERDMETPVMRHVVNKLVEKHDGICGVFSGTEEEGYNFIIGSKSMDCRSVATKMKELFDARGGGSAQMIQGLVSVSAEQIKRVLL